MLEQVQMWGTKEVTSRNDRISPDVLAAARVYYHRLTGKDCTDPETILKAFMDMDEGEANAQEEDTAQANRDQAQVPHPAI